MKLNESEKFWCPMSFGSNQPFTCRGKECAAWRWNEPKFGSVESRRGYCGMAGEPKYPLSPDNEN
jgi:hypothetical protein